MRSHLPPLSWLTWCGACSLFSLFLAASAAPHTPQNAAWNVNIEPSHEPRLYRGEWRGHSYTPSPPDWRAIPMYQLLTDRFADGDPRNNEIYTGEFDVRDIAYRHGGDFRGMTKHLSYIRGLGCEAIWISPLFQNGEIQYHQYAMNDFTLIDKRLGTLEEFRELVNEAHRLGMYVIVDIVMNHMANAHYFEGHEYEGAAFKYHEEEYNLVPRSSTQLLATPVGPQAYMDFWVNNTYDPACSYGEVYGRFGQKETRNETGGHCGSDFHHNGDLEDYAIAFQINFGKIYGIMDDLRMEHPRTQEKYIAMTKALISSTDIDGFRVDTPMQVPLNFFKAWSPVMREHARSLGKERFMIFGEFYVAPERYATMMGRGRVPAGYGKEEYIDDIFTMKGGIVYPYYFYLFTALVFGMTDYANGLRISYAEELRRIDTFDPDKNQYEYSQLNFCNNHDNWRLQTAAGAQQFQLCLAIITFWPGIPLHYAGDEQLFNNPGSALDGWAREEMVASMAWRSMTTDAETGGNLVDRDNFDMTAPMYRYIHRLNGLRKAIFGSFGSEMCDTLHFPTTGYDDIIAFQRGCTSELQVLLVANTNRDETREFVLESSFASGTVLRDALHYSSASWTVSLGSVSVSLEPLEDLLLVPAAYQTVVEPEVLEVTPKHGEVLSHTPTQVSIRYDRPMNPTIAPRVTVRPVQAQTTESINLAVCSCRASGCDVIDCTLPDVLPDGFYIVYVEDGVVAADGARPAANFKSHFLVSTEETVISDPSMHDQAGLICNNFDSLCHKAAGARWFRVASGGGSWSDWMEFENVTKFRSWAGTQVLVQYHAADSGSHIVGDCIQADGKRCPLRYHEGLFLNLFPKNITSIAAPTAIPMQLVRDFTWGLNLTFAGYRRARFATEEEWTGKPTYGVAADRGWYYSLPAWDDRSETFMHPSWQEGTDLVRRFMMTANVWTEHESITTAAEWNGELWLNSLCNTAQPACPDITSAHSGWICQPLAENQECVNDPVEAACYEIARNDLSDEMSSCAPCGCCRRAKTVEEKQEVYDSGPQQPCCILFNDMYLNFTVHHNLTLCSPEEKGTAPYMREKILTQSVDITVKRLLTIFDRRATWLAMLHLLPIIVGCVMCVWWLRWRSVLTVHRQLAFQEVDGLNSGLVGEGITPNKVLVASLEHICILPDRGVMLKVVAGGLGKVAGLMCQYHPGDFLSVHPVMSGKDYSFCDKAEIRVHAVVEGIDMGVDCEILTCTRPATPGTREPNVKFYFVDHPVFRKRESIYPSPQTAKGTLIFWSLWNQVVASLIDELKPDLFHCPDFHTAMAPCYVKKPVPLFVILHNAEYQGAINTQQMGRKEVAFFSNLFNLSESYIRKNVITDGGFNMLRPLVNYALKHQNGYGFCTVSRTYAFEAMQKHQVLWPLPKLRGLENCMPENERPALPLDGSTPFAVQRKLAKLSVQAKYSLDQNEEARVFVFLGRWVKQKGMDYIADVTEWMLDTYKDAQLLVIGPVGDSFGSYTREKLETLQNSGKYAGRLFVFAGFLMVPKELKLACDFCLMPSRDEPFGYVDIEFGWFGALTVGAFKGGLGKVPGFYFQSTNADSDKHMQDCLKRAISSAMACDTATFQLMSENARDSAFPVADWRDEISEMYSEIFANFKHEINLSREDNDLAPIEFCTSCVADSENSSQASTRASPDGLPPRDSGSQDNRGSHATSIEASMSNSDARRDPNTDMEPKRPSSAESLEPPRTRESLMELPGTVPDDEDYQGRLSTVASLRTVHNDHDCGSGDRRRALAEHEVEWGGGMNVDASELVTYLNSEKLEHFEAAAGGSSARRRAGFGPWRPSEIETVEKSPVPSAMTAASPSSATFAKALSRGFSFNGTVKSLLGHGPFGNTGKRGIAVTPMGILPGGSSAPSMPATPGSHGNHLMSMRSGVSSCMGDTVSRRVVDSEYNCPPSDDVVPPESRRESVIWNAAEGDPAFEIGVTDLEVAGQLDHSWELGEARTERIQPVGYPSEQSNGSMSRTLKGGFLLPDSRRGSLAGTAKSLKLSLEVPRQGKRVYVVDSAPGSPRSPAMEAVHSGPSPMSKRVNVLEGIARANSRPKISPRQQSVLTRMMSHVSGISQPRMGRRGSADSIDTRITMISQVEVEEPSIDDISKDDARLTTSQERFKHEVLEQEMTEEVLQYLVEQKLTRVGKYKSAPMVLESVQWDLSLAKEKHRISKLLCVVFFDGLIIDWIYAFVYVASPIFTALFTSQCCSAASRVAEPLTQAVTVLMWTCACCLVRDPTLLLRSALASRVLCTLPAIFSMPVWVAGVLAGISAGGDVLFIYFNFMGKQRGDVSKIGGRTGGMIVLRRVSEWLFLAVAKMDGPVLLAARLLSAFFMVILPFAALRWAPKPYHEFSLPDLQSRFVRGLTPNGQGRVLLYLGIANLMRNFLFPAEQAGFIQWRSLQEFKPDSMVTYAGGIALAQTLAIFVFAWIMQRYVDFTLINVKAFACFSLVPAALRAVAMVDVDMSSEANTTLFDLLVGFSAVLESFQLVATIMGIVAVVGSRWRLCVYLGLTTSLAGIARVLGSQIMNVTHGCEISETIYAERLAEDILKVSLVPFLIEICVRILSFPFFDMEISSSLWTRRQQKIAVMLALDARAKHEEYGERLAVIRSQEMEMVRKRAQFNEGVDNLHIQADALRELRAHNDELNAMLQAQRKVAPDSSSQDKKAA